MWLSFSRCSFSDRYVLALGRVAIVVAGGHALGILPLLDLIRMAIAVTPAQDERGERHIAFTALRDGRHRDRGESAGA